MAKAGDMCAEVGPEVPRITELPEVRALSAGPEPTHASVAAALAALDRGSLLLQRTEIDGPAAAAERIAADHGWPELQMRARLLRAELSRQGSDLVVAASIATQVNAWAGDHDDVLLLARSHNTLTAVYRHIGDHAESLAHAVASMAHTPSDAAPWIRATHLVALGIGLSLNAMTSAARTRFEEALALSRSTPDLTVELMVLNNYAYALHIAGDHDQAQAIAGEMRALQVRHQVAMDAMYLDTLARIEMQRGDYAEAERLLAPAIDCPTGPLFCEGDALPVCLLTLAESRRRRGALDEAQTALDWCRTEARQRGLPLAQALASREQAELHAARGEHREAYEELLRFHLDWTALQDTDREVRAAVLHAVYAIEEAQLARDRFRELAWRDPLTGVHNRRLVDDELPALISLAEQTGLPFSVALLDLDHFKQINDNCSHEAGDAVLREVADLITGCAPPAASVVRMGGEEFLVILPGCDHRSALTHAESIRTTIGEHQWGGACPIPRVTASIGVTTCRGRTTPAEILTLADRNMYAAKQAGRDRVVGDAV